MLMMNCSVKWFTEKRCISPIYNRNLINKSPTCWEQNFNLGWIWLLCWTKFSSSDKHALTSCNSVRNWNMFTNNARIYEWQMRCHLIYKLFILPDWFIWSAESWIENSRKTVLQQRGDIRAGEMIWNFLG